MNNQQGLSVMYHYVRPDGEQVPGGIRPIRTSEFEDQLDWLCDQYDVLPADEFLERLSSRGSHFLKPPCLLTFDDGTKDHAEVVTPILQRRGLSGVFFVLTWPAELGKMPLTHAIHWLLSGDERNVWETFERYARNYLGGVQALGSEQRAREIYYYETPLRARIKYAANMELPMKAVEQIVNAALRQAGLSARELARQWFVDNNDIQEMHSAGMTIAMHGCSHRSLQTLGPVGIISEIEHSSNYLAKLTGKRPDWFACPFGGSGASMDSLNAMYLAMKKVGVVGSVTTEKHMVDRNHCNPLFLPRMDTIDLPPKRMKLLAA